VIYDELVRDWGYDPLDHTRTIVPNHSITPPPKIVGPMPMEGSPLQVSISHPTGQQNYSVVAVNDITFYFSYETCVAFDAPIVGLVASENIWTQTTGKHLNNIEPNKNNRVPHAEFERLLKLSTETYEIRELMPS
jgi:hypothetical protein